jgi:hypothetical protein
MLSHPHFLKLGKGWRVLENFENKGRKIKMKKMGIWCMVGLFLLLVLEIVFLLWIDWPPYFMRQEQFQPSKENVLNPIEICVYTPSGRFKHVPPNDFLLNFRVRIWNRRDWHMWGNCFDQTIFLRYDSKYIYSHMLSSTRSEVDFEGPLDQLALINGYCYFYIRIEASYLPYLDGSTIYPPADFQIAGIPKKEKGQEWRMQRLEKLAVFLTSRKDQNQGQQLPITIVNVAGNDAPFLGRYKAGSLVFKVEIPK